MKYSPYILVLTMEVTAVASGLNEKRRELIKMFRRLDEVEFILVEYPDRLARFGYTYLEEHAAEKR